MGERTVTIDEAAYRALTERQHPDESLGETILRITGETEGIDRDALGPGEQAVVDVLDGLFEAQRAEDMEAYLDAMHPAVDTTAIERQLRRIWSEYDLAYESTITDLTVEGDEARTVVEQTTEKVAGPAFEDNVTTDVHYLEYDDGRWWIVGTETRETDFLS